MLTNQTESSMYVNTTRTLACPKPARASFSIFLFSISPILRHTVLYLHDEMWWVVSSYVECVGRRNRPRDVLVPKIKASLTRRIGCMMERNLSCCIIKKQRWILWAPSTRSTQNILLPLCGNQESGFKTNFSYSRHPQSVSMSDPKLVDRSGKTTTMTKPQEGWLVQYD